MTTVLLPGATVWDSPPRPELAVSAAISAGTALSAAGQQYGLSGTFWHKDGPGVSKNITSIQFNAGAITSAGGTTLKTGVQGVATGTTAPERPDGTYINAGTAFGTSLLSGLSATATNSISIPSSALTVGAKASVMFEFTGFGGADSFILRGLGITSGTTTQRLASGILSRNNAGWSILTVLGNVLLGCDDGSYGTISRCSPFDNLSNATFSTGGTRQNGLFINYPFPYRVYGGWALLNLAANAAGSFIVASDPLGTPTNQLTFGFDVAWMQASASQNIMDCWFTSTYDVAANTPIIAFVDSNTANNVTMTHLSMNAAANLDAVSGQNQCRYTRTGTSGVFAVANSGKDFPFMGLYIGALSDGSGGGGTTRGIIYGS